MIVKGNIPMAVLSQQLADAIAGRKVRAAVFTTFTFDPGFFELHILPVLFDQSFHQVDKVRRVQLEEALTTIDRLAVYYDRSGLSQDAEPAGLDYRRIDVRYATGIFHPKVALILVDEPVELDEGEEEAGTTSAQWRPQSLLVTVMSANLTRSGYWENIECAHIDEIQHQDLDDSRSSYRHDLLWLINRIRDCAGPDEDQSALDMIHTFLRYETPRDKPKYASFQGRYHTRLFSGVGKLTFSQWLADLRLGRRDWNLEVISPYFDHSGAGPLEDLIDIIGPRETRVYLPRDPDGTARVTREAYEAVSELAHWANLPEQIKDRGRGASSEKLLPRNVHAKVYRLWNSRERRDLLIIGSVNLTSAAHSHSRAGNLEAAFLVDVSEDGYPRRWWLERRDTEPETFSEQGTTEEDGLETSPFDLSLRFDWADGRLAYRLGSSAGQGFEICETNGHPIFTVERPRSGQWINCSPEDSDRVRSVLPSTSFLLIRHPKGSWRVLVREENMGYRPSLVLQLTPEEILEYWALLSAEQRATFVEGQFSSDAALEGLSVRKVKERLARRTMFDRFAGIFHAFGCLHRFIDEAIAEGRDAEAETRLAGAKYDSLPVLLEKILKQLEQKDGDPIHHYVTFLCAKQLRDTLARKQRDFIRQCKKRLSTLDSLLQRLPEIREAVPLGAKEKKQFLDWYESAFLKELS